MVNNYHVTASLYCIKTLPTLQDTRTLVLILRCVRAMDRNAEKLTHLLMAGLLVGARD